MKMDLRLKEVVYLIKSNKPVIWLMLTKNILFFSIFWFFILLFINLPEIFLYISNKTCIITVYLDDSLCGEDLISLQEKIKNLDKVKEVEFISKDDGLRILKERLKDKSYILDTISKNPLPALFKIKVYDGVNSWETLPLIASSISNINGVEKVFFSERIVLFLQKVFDITKIMSFLAIVVFCIFYLLFKILIISFLLSKEREKIRLLQLLGSSNAFIILPYILQTIVLGIISLVISFGLFCFIYKVFTNKFIYISSLWSNFIPLNILLLLSIWVIIIDVLISFVFIRLKLFYVK